MNTDLDELYRLSEDVLNASAMVYDYCREAGARRKNPPYFGINT